MIHKYIINGTPVSYEKAHYLTNHGNGSMKEFKLQCVISLQGQHTIIDHDNPAKETPPFTGYLELVYDFYFPLAEKYRGKMPAFYSTPGIASLIKFYDEVATGIIWKDSRLILKTTAHKFYEQTSRTEITVTRLDQ